MSYFLKPQFDTRQEFKLLPRMTPRLQRQLDATELKAKTILPSIEAPNGAIPRAKDYPVKAARKR